MKRKLRSFLLRILVAGVLAWMLATVALPRIPPHLWIADIFVPLLVFVFLCYTGKLIIDNFFYDRY